MLGSRYPPLEQQLGLHYQLVALLWPLSSPRLQLVFQVNVNWVALLSVYSAPTYSCSVESYSEYLTVVAAVAAAAVSAVVSVADLLPVAGQFWAWCVVKED